MNKIIGVTELQRNFRAVFDEVVRRKIPYVLTRGSRPEAVMIPYDQYLKYVQADEEGVLARFDKVVERMSVVNARYSEAEVEADLNKATRAVRKRTNARRGRH